MKRTFLLRVLPPILLIIFAACPAYCSTYFVATNGNDSYPGDIDHPFRTIGKGVSTAVAGDTIYVRAGTYAYTGSSTAITLGSKSGSSPTNRCSLIGYNGERPFVDCSAMTGTGADCIKITGSYWYVKGLDFKGAPRNGINLNGGSYNIIEFCSSYENRNTGVQLQSGAAYNQIINCDSYYNCDAAQDDADGFAPKMDVGTGNYFYGCRSWQNSDDAYDGYLRGADDVNTTYEKCWAFKAGYLKSGAASNGNGNGFKMGGSDDKTLKHNVILINCMAFSNRVKGFDQNSNKGSMTLYNCTAFSNGSYNYSIPIALASGKTATVTNCDYLTGSNSLGAFVVQTTNSWMPPFVVTSADFVSIDPASAYGPRTIDGNLPDIAFMHLVTGSDLIDGGTDVNLPYEGNAPDLGCFEYIPGGSPPGTAGSPTPADLATDVSRTQDLSWTAGSGTPSHNVYFGTVDPPPFIRNQTDITYDTGTMIGGITYYWRIDEKNAYGTTTGTLWSFTTVLPPLPGAATNPIPTNGATDVSLTQVLIWTAGSEAASHDVYFGTVNPPPFIVNQTETTYDPPGALNPGTTYYWRIDEKNASGTTTGTIWNFIVPPMPGQATNPSPSDGATDVSITQDLSWTADSNATSHDVYFGTTNPPLFQVNQTSTTYDTGAMNSFTTYYWRIDEKNSTGTTTGTVWNFTTQDTMPPTPNPMEWAIEPNAISSSDITMTAATATDISGVEYYFANITDPNHDSGWVASPFWTDTGLAINTTYTYIVIAHDKSPNQNETGWSSEANATTLRYNCTDTIISDIDNNCKVDFMDYALLASHWNEMPPLNNIAVNGTFDTDIIPGWQRFDPPSAMGEFVAEYDYSNGNPPGSVVIGTYADTTDVRGYYFYQVIPVTAGKQYKLSAEWMGDISGYVASDPCNLSNWVEVLVAFVTNADANMWTAWTDPNAVMYGKTFGVANKNIDSSGTWSWESITASQTNGPADGVFTASSDVNYIVVAFSEGGLLGSGVGYFYVDNVKVEEFGCPIMDLNSDCSFDWLDIQQFAEDWLICNRDPQSECWQ